MKESCLKNKSVPFKCAILTWTFAAGGNLCQNLLADLSFLMVVLLTNTDFDFCQPFGVMNPMFKFAMDTIVKQVVKFGLLF